MPVIAYWPDGIYCHLPDNRILRIARDGSSMVLLAQLPGGVSDGGLAFDSTGKFGYALLAATGGSGSSGGDVYAIRRDGRVQHVGAYPGPGGADGIAMAPKVLRQGLRPPPALDRPGQRLGPRARDRPQGERAGRRRAGSATATTRSWRSRRLRRPAPPARPPPASTCRTRTRWTCTSPPRRSSLPYAGQVLVGTRAPGELLADPPDGEWLRHRAGRRAASDRRPQPRGRGLRSLTRCQKKRRCLTRNVPQRRMNTGVLPEK